MTAPFDFPAWLQATGWSHAEAGRRLDLTRETVARMASGGRPVSDKTAIRCSALAAEQIERLRPYVHAHESQCQNCAPPTP